ncbi:MAG: DmsC/YnfH family molybdoenzyme membrane anchor subunit [bacterium]
MERNPNWAAQFFLILCPTAAGCFLGSLILDPGGGNRPFVVVCGTVALVCVVLGAATPVFTIKKPSRSCRFLAGIGHSPLSRQAALVGLFAVLLLIDWILVLAGVYAFWFGIVAEVVGAAAVLAAGMTYLLGAQPVWRHWSTPLALFGGLLALGVSMSLVIALGWREVVLAGTSGGLAARILVLVGVAGLAVALGGRAAYLGRGGQRTEEARELTRHGYRRTHRLTAVLLAVGAAAAAASIASDWVIIVAFVALLAGLFAHWRLFFLTATALSWKAEVQWLTPAPAAGKE